MSALACAAVALVSLIPAAAQPTAEPARVEILAVPVANLGFEDAVRTAVSSWRFQPLTLNGLTIHADDSGQLVLAAQMATGLWRFRPALKDGCPVRTRINIEQKFVPRN